MQLKEHLAYGGIATAGLIPFYGPESFYFLAGSILIDVDHYVDFLYYGRFRNWKIRDMFRFHDVLASWHDKGPSFCALEAFHTAEFVLGVFLVAFFSKSAPVWFLFWGMLFHLVLDVLHLSWKGVLHLRALSFVEYAVRRKKMIRAGTHPETIFDKAYSEISKDSDEKKDPNL